MQCAFAASADSYGPDARSRKPPRGRLHDPAAAPEIRSRRSPTFAPEHYHGPGGLNGRVRDGNGCGPAGMVAGNPAAGRSGPAAESPAMVGHDESDLTHTPRGLCGHAPLDPHGIDEAVCRPPDRRAPRGGPIGVVKLLGC